jgi:hypothetical protein
MTAAGEILNLPVAIPMRPVVPTHSLPQRHSTTRYAPPHRIYRIPHQSPPDASWYDADGYTAKVPEKGNVIDLFA